MFLQRITIYQHERGLRFKDGKFVGVVEPGSYRIHRKTEKIANVDLREQSQMVGGQEILTSDGATVRISILVTARIADAYLYYQTIPVSIEYGDISLSEGLMFLHQQIQILMRDWVSELTLQEVLDRRKELPESILPNLQTLAAAHGGEVLNVQLMDFNIAGTLKSAQADILKAELEGKAAMQRARNEASTLRSLINSAKLTQDHPGLLELRILSSGQKPRVTFMVGQPEGKSSAAIESDSE